MYIICKVLHLGFHLLENIKIGVILMFTTVALGNIWEDITVIILSLALFYKAFQIFLLCQLQTLNIYIMKKHYFIKENGFNKEISREDFYKIYNEQIKNDFTYLTTKKDVVNSNIFTLTQIWHHEIIDLQCFLTSVFYDKKTYNFIEFSK